MQINGPDAREWERRIMKRALVQISSVEIDFRQGLVTAGDAMMAITAILESSKAEITAKTPKE